MRPTSGRPFIYSPRNYDGVNDVEKINLRTQGGGRFLERVEFSVAPDLIGASPGQMEFDFSSWDAKSRNGTLVMMGRHGQTPSNLQGKIIGSEVPDEDLTEKGIVDANALASSINQLQEQKKISISSIHCSPLVRAFHTGKIIGQKTSFNIQTHEGLREIDWGDASGYSDKARNEQWGSQEDILMHEYSRLLELWDHLPVIPNAEKYNALLERVLREVHGIVKNTPENEREVLLINHGRVINTLMRACILEANDKNRTEGGDRDKVPYAGNCDMAVFLYDDSEREPKLEFQGLAQLS
ncbi:MULTISPECIES: histidine phosphatase family protein [unclassified Rhizobacter]|uniref:histidine phosphatase family protein n=1 Tax=unclassified Rhizobacter TaxID=2640088 RepID=UPI0009E9007F|nr:MULTISPECIES: histidine phosphatase family protein [unclassified Rhizobacter]